MSLQTIEQAFASAAAAEWTKIKAEGVKIEQTIVAEGETLFSQLSVQFAPLLMTIISNLATGQLAKLSGNEKTNLAATSLVDQAVQQGVTILADDATAMIKNGFEAFKKAAPDLGLPSNVTQAASEALNAGEAVVQDVTGSYLYTIGAGGSGGSDKVSGSASAAVAVRE